MTITLLGQIPGLQKDATARVYFYALTFDGDLLKYDPETDQIVERKPNAGQNYITQRNIDADKFGPSRILDVTRGKIVTFTATTDPGVVVLDMRAGMTTDVAVGPSPVILQLGQIVYPRNGSRFYVHWLRQANPTAPLEVVMTDVELSGRILGTTSSPIPHPLGGSLPHADGRSFYVLDQLNALRRVDGETLTIREAYDLNGFYKPGVTRCGIADVREGRVLLSEREGSAVGLLDPRILFTVDLTSRVASPRIITGLGSSDARLIPGGRTILLQEARTATDRTGAGRLHMYDVATANKLGMVSFRADEGAEILGFHPDGRRLFMRAWNEAPSTVELQIHLVIVDVVNRTVIRDRPFENIGVAVDFVDEP